MIKVTVLYPNTAGSRFDHDYYRDTHMPLVASRMGDACKHWSVDKGIAGSTPGSAPPFVAICHIFCESVEAFEASFDPHINEILADIPNYTEITPVFQISEIVVA